MTRVLLFGGTAEGRQLACQLAEAGVEVCVSVASEAGAKVLPQDLPGLSIHQGKLTQEEKRQMMQAVDVVVDATHPYAADISRSVSEAAAEVGCPCIRVVRPAGDTEGCLLAGTVEEAVSLVRRPGNVLSTTGSKQVALYAALPEYRQRLYARVLDDEASIAACQAIGLEGEHILAKRGPFSVEENLADIQRCNIQTLITKDGGAAGGYPEKLAAARQAGVEVIVVARPTEETGVSSDEAFRMIMERENPTTPFHTPTRATRKV